MTPNPDPIAATLKGIRDRGIVDVDEAEIAAAWRTVLKTELERRIGVRLGSGLTDRELDAFAHAAEAGDAGAWLTENVPHYPGIVAEETDELVRLAVLWFIVGARHGGRRPGAPN